MDLAVQERKKKSPTGPRLGGPAALLLHDLGDAQHDVRDERAQEHRAQHRRAVPVVVHPVRVALAQLVRAVHEDDGRVRDREQRREREEPRADQPAVVVRRDEVEQRRRDRADVDGEVQPFLCAWAGKASAGQQAWEQ